MAFRSSSSLFSLQPSQGRGLSAFGAYGADLPKIGSMQEFIDPTLDGGEGLSLDASEQPLDLSTLQQGEGGELVSSVTGARIPGQSVLGAATTSTTGTRASGPQGPELSQDREEVDWTKLAQGAPGAVTKGISALQSLRSLFGGTPDITGAPGETKFDFDVPEIDWENPEAVSQWLASNPEAQHSLFGQEVGQSPQDISSWLQQTGGFDLGDTRRQ